MDMKILNTLPKSLPKSSKRKVMTMDEMLKATRELKKIIEKELEYVKESKQTHSAFSV